MNLHTNFSRNTNVLSKLLRTTISSLVRAAAASVLYGIQILLLEDISFRIGKVIFEPSCH